MEQLQALQKLKVTCTSDRKRLDQTALEINTAILCSIAIDNLILSLRALLVCLRYFILNQGARVSYQITDIADDIKDCQTHELVDLSQVLQLRNHVA